MSKPVPSLHILRPHDLLVLDLAVANLSLSDDGVRLHRTDPAAAALLIFTFPAQHVAEQAYFAFKANSQTPDEPPVAALSAGRSRLVFALPPGTDHLLLTTEALLNWSALVPVLPGNALPPDALDGPPPGLPGPAETSVEFPYRLFLSPDATATWRHRRSAFTSAGRSELWHTTLRGSQPTVPVRAVGRRPTADVRRTSLSGHDLQDLVTLTADFGVRPKTWQELGWDFRRWQVLIRAAGLFGYHYQPRPIDAELLTLTALGASARLRGHWDYPPQNLSAEVLSTFGMPNVTLSQYDHVAGLGRDQVVRVVRRGFFSTGHRASIVKTTERRFEPVQLAVEQTPAGPVATFGARAYLRQWFSLVVKEPLINVAGLAGGYEHGGREMPLRTLRLTTLTTPPIDLDMAAIEEAGRNNYVIDNPQLDPQDADEEDIQRYVQTELERVLTAPFWVSVGGADFEFGIEATDWEGAPVTFASPLVFIPAESVEKTQVVTDTFLKGPPTRRRRMLNQTLAMADPTGSAPGSTRTPVESLTFQLQAVPVGRIPALPATYRPRWVVAVTTAQVHVAAVERLTGRADAVGVDFDPKGYLDQGLTAAANPAGAFLRLKNSMPVALGAERGGGVAKPDASVQVLSSRQGALPAVFTKPAVSATDMAALFGNAKLFGTIALSDVLGPVGTLSAQHFSLADLAEAELASLLDTAGSHLVVPVLRTRELVRDGVPYAVESRYLWKPRLESHTPILEFDVVPGTASELVLDARTVTPLGGGPASSEVRGELRHFRLSFFGVVTVTMDRLAFTARPGAKPDITAEGFDLRFSGPLEFINTLREILPADGLSDPPAVSVSPAGISAGYSLAVPSVGVGIFSLQNLSLGALLSIPFTDKPAGLQISISERHHPFLVSVSLFGGGGFFALGVSARGVESIEAAIEFGGSIALNLGIASGGVEVMAGIYFGLTGKVTTLTGYLRCGGYLEVLGLISISVEFYLGFSYRDKGGGHSEVWGQASVTVCVKVAFFSKSVSLSVERRFAGASGDPTFDQCVDPDDWEQYALAFSA